MRAAPRPARPRRHNAAMAPTPARERPRRDADTSPPLAAIDMGSNSFRLEIGSVDAGRYVRHDYLKETVRLGAGLDAEGLLGDDAAQRGLDCLARFAKRLEAVPASHVRAVATQTLREAKNRDAFLARAQQALGRPIEVISGREEARLIYAGVARLQPSTEPRLVIDIGGRSTEMILGQGLVPERAESFQVGSVSLSMRWFESGRFSAEAFRRAQVAAGAELEEALEPFARERWTEALGASGTVGAVSQLLAASGRPGHEDGQVTPEGLRWLIERCIAAGRIDKLQLPGLKEDRRTVIGGGLAILYTLATQFGIAVLHPARGALRQGVIFDLATRLASEAGAPLPELDIREGAVRDLQRRFGVDAEHGARVAEVAARALDGLLPEAGSETRRELRWAALLHEVGMGISHHDHHRHSAYVLAHADAAGFSQNQLRRIADLVLGQRGGLRKVEARFAEPAFAPCLLALRAAVIACHARDEAIAATLHVTTARGAPVYSISDEDAQAQPRLVYLLQQEIDAWSRTAAPRPRLDVTEAGQRPGRAKQHAARPSLQ